MGSLVKFTWAASLTFELLPSFFFLKKMSKRKNAEDEDSARPLVRPPAPLKGEVSLDTPPLSFDHDLNEVEQQAFDSCKSEMRSCSFTIVEVEAQRLRAAVSLVRELVTRHPKIAKVRKGSTLTGFLLFHATYMLRHKANPDLEVIELVKFLIEKNPSALFWRGPYYYDCLRRILDTPLIHLWLAENLPSVLERACQIYQDGRGGDAVLGLSPPEEILNKYFLYKTVSASQLLKYFDKFPQSLDEHIYNESESTMVPILYFIDRTGIYFGGSDDERGDEHFQVLKCMASKRPELLCTGEVSVVLTAMHWANEGVGYHGSQDKACSLIKILVRACPVSILTEGTRYQESADILPMTPFDFLPSIRSRTFRDELNVFFDRCLKQEALLEADLSLVREVLNKVKVIEQIHRDSFHANKECAYQEWASKFFRKYEGARKEIFQDLK